MSKFDKSNASKIRIKIVGLILSEGFQRCKIFTSKLSKYHPKRFSPPLTRGYLEMDWSEYLLKLRKSLGGQTWAVQKGVVVFINNQFIGSEDEFFERFKLYEWKNPSSEEIKSIAKREYLEYLNSKNLLYTYLELSLAGEYMGSLLFELRPDLLPRSSVKFATFCDPENHLGISYKGSTVYRVCKSGWLQAGKIDDETGFLEDESLCYKHDRRGILSFCNDGKHTNTAQFFITFNPAQWMDEFYVAFGRVVEGSDVLRRIEHTKCFYESPVQEIKIIDCGLVMAGMGKHLPTKLKMKGLTIGSPFIDPETFVNLVLDSFCDALFERLDDEIKRAFHTEWIGKMIWDMIKAPLAAREPIDSVEDTRDRPSNELLSDLYLKGLYDLQEIPDHYIMSLLNEIIGDVMAKTEITDMARSIMNVILEGINYRGSGEIVADKFMKELIKNVNDVIFGPEESELSVTKDDSKTGYVRRSISEMQSQPSKPSSVIRTSSHLQKSEELLEVRNSLSSTKELVVKFVIESILKSINNSS